MKKCEKCGCKDLLERGFRGHNLRYACKCCGYEKESWWNL